MIHLKKRFSNSQMARAGAAVPMLVVGSPLTAFASSGETTTTGMTSLLGSFTSVAAWMWAEIGKLLAWILSQPILLLAMSLFFVGAIVSFFIRVFHSV